MRRRNQDLQPLIQHNNSNQYTDFTAIECFKKQKFGIIYRSNDGSEDIHPSDINSHYLQSIKQHQAKDDDIFGFNDMDQTLNCLTSCILVYDPDYKSVDDYYWWRCRKHLFKLPTVHLCDGDIVQRNDNYLYKLKNDASFMHCHVVSCSQSKTMDDLFLKYTPLSSNIYQNIILNQYIGADEYHYGSHYFVSTRYLYLFHSFDINYILSLLFGHSFLLIFISWMLLCIKYYHNKTTYLMLSVIMFIFATILLWFLTLQVSHPLSGFYPMCCLKIPIMGVIALTTCRSFANELIIHLSVAGFCVFPQYVLLMSYSLQFDTFDDVFILIVLLLFLISLIIVPTWSWCMTVESQYLLKGLILSWCDRFKIRVNVILTMLPILMIELIHFFPLLYVYFIDGDIEVEHLIVVLLLFNASKIMIMVSEQCSNYDFYSKGYQGVLFLIITYSILPLIPYVIFFMRNGPDTVSIKNVIKSSYFIIMVAYIWISYCGMISFLMSAVGFDVLSITAKCLMTVVLILILWITFIFPKLYCTMYRLNSGFF